jgi:hypothetical protein
MAETCVISGSFLPEQAKSRNTNVKAGRNCFIRGPISVLKTTWTISETGGFKFKKLLHE